MSEDVIETWTRGMDESDTVPRAVADRLADALEASLAVMKHPDPSGHPALAEYRKAVGND